MTVYRPTMLPTVQRAHGGAFLVNLGSASDEFREELRQIVDEVDRLVAVAALFEELLSREIALLVMCDRGGRVRQMSWRGVGEALPVYPDLSSLIQAAKDLKLDPGVLAWVHLSPRDLFAWVDREPFGGVALNAYSAPTHPTYFFINRAQVKALANGVVWR